MSKSNTNMIIAVVVVVVVVGAVGAVVFLPGILTPVEEQLKIAVLLPANINDFAWNYEMYYSATAMDQAYPDVQIDVFQDLGQGASVKDVMRDLAEEGYQILIGHTFSFGLFMQDLADELSDTILIGSNIRTDEYVNTFGYEGGNHEASYVAGYLAGSLTKTGKLGYMDGFEYGSTVAIANNFYLGAMAANDTINMTAVWANTWEDMDLAREQAQALIDVGVDQILARTSVPGAIQAGANNPGTYIYGAQADQSSLAPTTVMASMVANNSRLIQFAIDTWEGPGFTNTTQFGDLGPARLTFGVKDQGIFVAFNSVLFDNTSIVSASLKAEVLDVYQALLNGSHVPVFNETRGYP